MNSGEFIQKCLNYFCVERSKKVSNDKFLREFLVNYIWVLNDKSRDFALKFNLK